MLIFDTRGTVGSRAKTAIVQVRDDSGLTGQDGGGRGEKIKTTGINWVERMKRSVIFRHTIQM